MAPKKKDSLADFEKINKEWKEQQEKKIDMVKVRSLSREFKKTFNDVKILLKEDPHPKKSSRLRSGATRKPKKEAPCYTEGKYVNKGMEEAKQCFEPDEVKYLENTIKRVKSIDKLDFDQLKYFITIKFFQELKDIQEGKTKCLRHDQYEAQKGKCMKNLLSETKTTLFTNEQVSYINGCLQGAFNTEAKDRDGNIQYELQNYVTTVLNHEITILIVQHVKKFKSREEAQNFIDQHCAETFMSSDYDG